MLIVQQLLNVYIIWEKFTKKEKGFYIGKCYCEPIEHLYFVDHQTKKKSFFRIELLLRMKNGSILIISNEKIMGLG